MLFQSCELFEEDKMMFKSGFCIDNRLKLLIPFNVLMVFKQRA